MRLAESLSAKESGLNLDREARLLDAHPPCLSGYLDKPGIILGEGGTIALWYLPGAIGRQMQVSMS